MSPWCHGNLQATISCVLISGELVWTPDSFLIARQWEWSEFELNMIVNTWWLRHSILEAVRIFDIINLFCHRCTNTWWKALLPTVDSEQSHISSTPKVWEQKTYLGASDNTTSNTFSLLLWITLKFLVYWNIYVYWYIIMLVKNTEQSIIFLNLIQMYINSCSE